MSLAQLWKSQKFWLNILAATWNLEAGALWLVIFWSLQTFPDLTDMKASFGDMSKMSQGP